MRKKHFKLGLLMLAGLVGYFLTLSAVLVASARMSDGGSSSASKTSHLGKETPRKLASNFRSDSKSSGNKSGYPFPSMGGRDAIPCSSSETSCTTAFPGEDGPAGRSWRGAHDSNAAGSKGGSFGGHDFSYPAAYGSPFNNGGGPAFGPFANFGGDGAPQDGGNDGPPGKGKTSPDFSGPDPQISFSDPDPSQFPPKDPPDAKTPPIESTAALPVPEPSTFWVLIASLTALVIAPGSIGRALRTRLSRKTRFDIA